MVGCWWVTSLYTWQLIMPWMHHFHIVLSRRLWWGKATWKHLQMLFKKLLAKQLNLPCQKISDLQHWERWLWQYLVSSMVSFIEIALWYHRLWSLLSCVCQSCLCTWKMMRVMIQISWQKSLSGWTVDVNFAVSVWGGGAGWMWVLSNIPDIFTCFCAKTFLTNMCQIFFTQNASTR